MLVERRERVLQLDEGNEVDQESEEVGNLDNEEFDQDEVNRNLLEVDRRDRMGKDEGNLQEVEVLLDGNLDNRGMEEGDREFEELESFLSNFPEFLLHLHERRLNVLDELGRKNESEIEVEGKADGREGEGEGRSKGKDRQGNPSFHKEVDV